MPQLSTATRAVTGLTGLALLAGGAATPAAAQPADAASYNEQVALVDETGAQPEHKSHLNGTAQVTSRDGRFVVFSTDAALVPWDTNGLDDVYLRDTGDDITVLVSSDGRTVGNDYSFEPTISADGRYVAFTTWATNLTEDTNGSTLDVLVKDMQTMELQVASVTSDGRQRGRNSFFPVISDNGLSVSFQTFSRFGKKDRDRTEDVYVRNIRTGKTRQASLLPGGDRDVRGPVLNGDISGDGSVVVFGNANHLWARDMRSGETIRFHQEADSPPCQPFPSGSAGRPVISGNGRFVAFSSCATDLPGENGRFADIYRVDLVSGDIVRAHRSGNGNSYLPSLSRSGRYVGFGSEAANLVSGDDTGPDAFVADVRERTVTRASQSVEGTAGNKKSATTAVAISGDGRSLAYTSYADNLVEGDAFDLEEVFVWRR